MLNLGQLDGQLINDGGEVCYIVDQADWNTKVHVMVLFGHRRDRLVLDHQDIRADAGGGFV